MRRTTHRLDRRPLRTDDFPYEDADHVYALRNSDPVAMAIWRAWCEKKPIDCLDVDDYPEFV